MLLESAAPVAFVVPIPTLVVVLIPVSFAENLPPATIEVLEKMDAQRAGNLPSDIKTTGPLLGGMAMNLPIPGMGGGGGGKDDFAMAGTSSEFSLDQIQSVIDEIIKKSIPL